ncbi:MAG: 3-deoxy-8-phosphooctulonate synthase [Deltaproteobacteria bacterium]|nr:3-deoxy-8-phosphooctulonate synthase [Deltaproteobacteria bacterium]
MMKEIMMEDFVMGGKNPFVLIAGPCVIENEETTREIASYLKEITDQLSIPFIFKASYDKANRTSLDSFRGPGLRKGLDVLKSIKDELSLPILSDVHRFEEIDEAAAVLDIIQIPAFLCRQTDFVTAVAATGRAVNVKKGQFLAPWDMTNVVEKVLAAGNDRVMITERGASFGYNNLVVDMCSLPIIRKMGFPVVFDATHSVQLPGGEGTSSGGRRDMALYLARAAIATGIDGLFMEVHPDPECALCDGPNSLNMRSLPDLLAVLKEIDGIVKKDIG